MSAQQETRALPGNRASEHNQNQIVVFSESHPVMCNHLNLEVSLAHPYTQGWNEDADDALIANRLDECKELELQLDGALSPFSDFSEEEEELHRASHDPADMVHSFQKHIQGMGTAKDRGRTSILIRDELPVRGVKMLQIRYEVHRWYRQRIQSYGPIPVCMQKDFAFLLIESNWYEDKLAAVLFMQEVLTCDKHISLLDLPRFEEMFHNNHVKVHKVCDHFAGKVLSTLVRQIEKNGEEFGDMINVLFAWTQVKNVLQARAAMHVLINYAKQVNLHERLIESARLMLTRPEEDAKSISGAALRAVSDVDSTIIMEFLNRSSNLENMSVVALQKATSRLTTEQKQYFRNLRRDTISRPQK